MRRSVPLAKRPLQVEHRTAARTLRSYETGAATQGPTRIHRYLEPGDRDISGKGVPDKDYWTLLSISHPEYAAAVVEARAATQGPRRLP